MNNDPATNCRPVGVKDIEDLDIDGFDTVPDYFLIVRNIFDTNSQQTYPKLLRVPGTKVMPNGNYDNVIVLPTNNAGFTVPERQVRAGHIVNGGSTYIMQYADATNTPDFLALGMLAGNMMVQNSGFIDIPEGHEYIVGQRYYVGANGVPTTDAASGYSLFVPVSSTRLAVDIRRVSMTGLKAISISANAATTASASIETEIPLSATNYTVIGTGLSPENSRVSIATGSNISAVEVSGSFYMSGSTTGTVYIEIVRNIGGDDTNTQVISRAQVNVGASSVYDTYVLSPQVAEVAEGDTISMYVHPGAPTMTVGASSYLTVKQVA